MTQLDPIAHIPGDYGRTKLSHTLQFVRDAEGFVTRRRAQYGPVFKNNILFQHGVLISDPDSARTILLDRSDNFSSQGGWENSIGKLFKRGLMLRDFEDHRLHRRIMQVAFRADAMATYADLMNPIIEESIAGWASQTRFSFYDNIKQLTLAIAARVFAGERAGADIGALNRAFVRAVNASITPIRREVPGSAFKRGMDGRRFLESYFGARIAVRRGSDAPDMFTRLCNSETEDGHRFTDDEIVDHMIFLLLAAHDTTTGTLSTMAWELGRRPEWQARLRDEIRDLDRPALRYEDRDTLMQTEWVFREAMRMHPPVPFMPRIALEACELGGFAIPAGTGVAVCSLLIHRIPEYWTDPLAFDPDRFSPERAEHRRHSHIFVPFGGGSHTCIGMHFAGLMVKAILTQVLQRFELATYPGQREHIVTVPIPKPKYGLPLRLRAVA